MYQFCMPRSFLCALAHPAGIVIEPGTSLGRIQGMLSAALRVQKISARWTGKKSILKKYE